MTRDKVLTFRPDSDLFAAMQRLREVHALTLVRSSTPDILLLDLGAAPARGLELLRRVTALPAAPAVVAMTLFHSPEAAAAAVDAGAVGLVGKDGFVAGLTQLLARLFPAEITA